MTRTFVSALILAIAAPTARASHSYSETAEDKVADAAIVEADRAPQWDAAAGFAIGSFHTGPVYDLAYGLDLVGGIRLGRLGLYADYTLLGLSNSPTTTTTSDGDSELTSGAADPSTGKAPSGLVQRLGFDAHYSLAHLAEATGGVGLLGDIWVEAGVGEQFVRWNAGGALHRTDISLGFGMQFGGRGLNHHGAYYFEVRATIARSPATYDSNLSTCAGPCDTATPPLGLDKSILFLTGVSFGS